MSNPQIKGVVQARGARIESATTGTVLTNVVANGQFGGSRLTIDTFTADAGKGAPGDARPARPGPADKPAPAHRNPRP